MWIQSANSHTGPQPMAASGGRTDGSIRHRAHRQKNRLRPKGRPQMLIVYEYLPLEPDAAHPFFRLVSRRYETGAMLITSNRSVAE